jgi:hypothetical protein
MWYYKSYKNDGDSNYFSNKTICHGTNFGFLPKSGAIGEPD